VSRPLSPTRRRFLEFLVAIIILHTLAIAVYYGLDIPGAPERHQKLYAWGWMGLTAVVVLVGLQRIKRARRQGHTAP
jgi:Mg2+ and Co2+ transporter CorA